VSVIRSGLGVVIARTAERSKPVRRLVQLVSIPLVALFPLAATTAATPPRDVTGYTQSASPTTFPAANGALRVELKPAVVRLREHATVAVSGIHTSSLEVLLDGATNRNGRALGWRKLRFIDGGWRGTLPAPALRGIYPLVLRTRAGAHIFRSQRLVLRVLALGTRTRPSFDDPADVARWWVRTVPQGALAALRAWPRPAFDKRDVRLHRLFVVAYSPRWHPRIDDRLGMFVTAFRDGYRGRWRLLEATVQP
jgi:hypothetical protein